MRCPATPAGSNAARIWAAAHDFAVSEPDWSVPPALWRGRLKGQLHTTTKRQRRVLVRPTRQRGQSALPFP